MGKAIIKDMRNVLDVSQFIGYNLEKIVCR